MSLESVLSPESFPEVAVCVPRTPVSPRTFGPLRQPEKAIGFRTDWLPHDENHWERKINRRDRLRSNFMGRMTRTIFAHSHSFASTETSRYNPDCFRNFRNLCFFRKN